ncbi:hypothetical protein [Ferroplasma sp.]|jgi:hypothetical protein|uniref:hypothetical protein n=1 Tax=Ferroplasma sp. TaxID=2591003 RepID=UPI002630F667|nr:hypothetical protein [Ferroplasma sp.]
MIKIPVVERPDILTNLLIEFRILFSRRQFSKYIFSSRISPTSSASHLNGIFLEQTNESNLNRFLGNIPLQAIFRNSVSLISRYSSDSVLAIDDTFLERSGKHIEDAGLVFEHTQGKSIWWMPYVTGVISGKEGIFPLYLELKEKSGPSKIMMQMGAIKRAITEGMYCTAGAFNSWYFASRLADFLGKENKTGLPKQRATGGYW